MTANFGWSYPAGAEHDPNAPYNQTEEEDCGFDEIHDALIDRYNTGRWEYVDVCLTGKDADLEAGGEQGFNVLEVSEEEVVCELCCGLSVAGVDVCLNVGNHLSDKDYEKKLEEYLDIAEGLVCGFPFGGDWIGDDWSLSHKENFTAPVVLVDDGDGEVNLDATCELVIEAFEEAVKLWESEAKLLNEALDIAAGWRDEKGEKVAAVL